MIPAAKVNYVVLPGRHIIFFFFLEKSHLTRYLRGIRYMYILQTNLNPPRQIHQIPSSPHIPQTSSFQFYAHSKGIFDFQNRL